MDYGLRYYFEFTAQTTGTPFRVELLQMGYEGLAKRLAIGASPVLSVEQEADGVRGSSLQMTLESATNGELSTLYTTDNKEWLVREYSVRNNTMQIIWQGYLVPELYTEMWVDAPYDVQVTAVDGLGLLKFIDYTPMGARRRLIDILADVLNNTGLVLPFHILSSLHDTWYPLSTVYEVSYINDATFAGKTCYEVLQEIMTATCASITQHENRWVIRRWKDTNVEDAVEITLRATADGSDEYKTLPMNAGSLGRMYQAEFYPLGSLQMDIVPAKSGAEFNFEYIHANSLFYNGAMTEAAEWQAFGDVEAPGIITPEDDKPYKREMYVLRNLDSSIEQTIPITMSDTTEFNLDIDVVPVFNAPELDIYDSFSFKGGMYITLMNIREFPPAENVVGVVGYYLAFDSTEQKSTWKPIQYILDPDTGKVSLYRAPEPFRVPLDTLITEQILTKESLLRVSIPIPPLPDGEVGRPNLELRIQNDSRYFLQAATFVLPLYVGGAYLLPINLPEGYEQDVEVASRASESAGGVDLAFSDNIFIDNGAAVLFNTITGAGNYLYSWKGTDKTYTFWGAFIQQYIDRHCQKRMKLSGTINAPTDQMPILIQEQHSGSMMAVGAYSWTQITEEVRIDLEEVLSTEAVQGAQDVIQRPVGPRPIGGKIITSLETTNAGTDTKVSIADGSVKMLVGGQQRVLVSGDSLGANDPEPITATLLGVNTTLANTTSTEPVTINRSFPFMSIQVPALGANVLLPAITLNTSLTGRGVYSLQVYLEWNNTGLKDSFVILNASNDTITIPPIVLTTNEPVGVSQTLKLRVSGTFAPASLSTSLLKFSVTTDGDAYVSTPTKIVEMARNGFRAAYSENRMFSLEYNESTGDLLMTHKGSMDIPGVLLWGTVDTSGSVLCSGGFYYGSAAKQDDGSYRITHSIGHQLYTVIAPGCTVVARGVDYIEITTESDTAFDFIILGNNDN